MNQEFLIDKKRQFRGAYYTLCAFVKKTRHFLCCGHIIRYFKIRKYLSSVNSQHCLQIGGGKHTIEGWLNADIIAGDIYLDATKRLPFPNNSFEYIFAEQFIEHISFQDSQRFLAEAYRILKDDGVIRLATPDLPLLIQIYQDTNSHVTQEQAMARHRRNHNSELSTPGHFLNDLFRLWGHKFIYDEETLKLVLESVGFRNISRCNFGESTSALLFNREQHADFDWMKYGFILILEGKK